jgi:dephospho-CoA kinase
MRRVLITGMSGTGKSTLIVELRALGYKAIDTGWDPKWEEPERRPDAGSGWVWREDRIEALLSTEDAQVLFVGACVPNQGRFYRRFDAVVLLTAPEAVIVERLRNRTNNPYGKSGEELGEVLRNKAEIEPMLRKRATSEIDTSVSVADVISAVLSQVDSQHIDPRRDTTEGQS